MFPLPFGQFTPIVRDEPVLTIVKAASRASFGPFPEWSTGAAAVRSAANPGGAIERASEPTTPA
jgi:hypothetical protein